MNFKPIKLISMLLIFIFFVAGKIEAENAPPKFEKKFKVDTQAGKILFLGDDGKVFKEFSIQRLVPGKSAPSGVSFSDNGKFVCVNNVTKKDVSGETVKKANAVVLDEKGNVVWTVKHDYLSDAMVSPNGKYIIGDGAGADDPMGVFYQNGKSLTINGGAQSTEENKAVFSNDGSFAFFVFRTFDRVENQKEFKRTKARSGGYALNAMAVDEDGNELWKIEKLTEGMKFGISDVVIEKETILLTLFEINSQNNLEFTFDKNGKILNQRTYKKN